MWHSMRQWKPFLFTFDAANIEITCDQASQRKWENLRTTWSQVNKGESDIVRDSLPARDIIQKTTAELFTFSIVSVYALSFLNDF